MQRSSNKSRKALDAMTRLLCVFALLFVSFAHAVPASSPQTASPQTSVGLSAYALPDGTLPVICQSPPGTGDDGNVAVFGECEFCRLAGAAILPAPGCAWAQPRTRAHVAAPSVRDPAVYRTHYAGTPTRGPPLA